MTQHVFVNRTLNMKHIKYLGLDMDHTLIRYHSKNFESLVYTLVLNALVHDQKYPAVIKKFHFDYTKAIRGLVVDSQYGNILKLSEYGAIRHSYHGTQALDYQEQKHMYRSTYVDLGDPNYIAIDTAFSLAFCVLYSQLVDYKDQNPRKLPDYASIAQDVLRTVDHVHSAGPLKQQIGQDLDRFVIRDQQLVEHLLRYKTHGKKIFILTNSDFAYTKLLLDYAINPYLPPTQHWSDLFDLVITSANKPRFFYDNLPFLSIDPHTQTMQNLKGPITNGLYQGGHAKQFTHDLKLNGDEILYIGDHIYGDILRLKKDCNWRTALVVEELGQEIESQKKAQSLELQIHDIMRIKATQELELRSLQSLRIEQNKPRHDQEENRRQEDLTQLDQQLIHLLHQQKEFYNTTWGRVFRSGAEESYFAYQVQRYACIYMEKLSDLLLCSPLSYFRSVRKHLPHDETSYNNTKKH